MKSDDVYLYLSDEKLKISDITIAKLPQTPKGIFDVAIYTTPPSSEHKFNALVSQTRTNASKNAKSFFQKCIDKIV